MKKMPLWLEKNNTLYDYDNNIFSGFILRQVRFLYTVSSVHKKHNKLVHLLISEGERGEGE